MTLQFHIYNKGKKTDKTREVSQFHSRGIKGYLYNKYVNGGSIIEIGGGRGGDLHNLNRNKVKFVLLVDISEGALEEAERRYNQMKK